MSICFEVTSVACPLQLEGTVNGQSFYFRARNNTVYCGIYRELHDEKPSFSLRQTVQLLEDHEYCSSQKVSLQEALGFIKMTYELSK